MDITTFDEKFIPEIVSFWNETFSDRRNFLPLTPNRFRRRILQVETSLESFEPKQFFVAREDEDVLGIIHVGTYPESTCRMMYGDEWEGGELGYVGIIAVHPEHRNRGIGSDLWEQAMDRIEHVTTVILDGQCLNPYYGNSLGPFQPLWGTTEGISVRPSQEATIAFFNKRGFEPRYEGISLEIEPEESRYEGTGNEQASIEVLEDEYPAVGEDQNARLPYPDAEEYLVIQLVVDEQTAGLLSAYPFRALDEEKWGIYEFRVAEDHRGNQYGEAMLNRALDEIRERGGEICETLALKELSQGAIALYESRGFEQVASWLIF